MGKKHAQRRAKRQRAKAERRRVETKRRKVEARARLQARAGHPERRRSEPLRLPSPPPPDDVLRPVQRAIEELRHGGGGELAVEVRAWTPAASEQEPARIVLEFRLFGLTATVAGSIDALRVDDIFDPASLPDRADDDYEEWQAAAVARQLLAAARTDVDAARALVAFWTLDELLVDELMFDRPLVVEVLRRLELGPELEDILDPIAPALPEPLRESWEQRREEWGDADVADFVLPAISWELTGPLVDFAEMVAGATYRSDWRPPWPTLEF